MKTRNLFTAFPDDLFAFFDLVPVHGAGDA
jgi:hypothetical protein